MNLVVWLYRAFVNPNKAVVNAILDFRAGHIGQPGHQKFVDPKQGLSGIYDDTVVLKELIFLIIGYRLIFTHRSKGNEGG
jgi:hypothetical protein